MDGTIYRNEALGPNHISFDRSFVDNTWHVTTCFFSGCGKLATFGYYSWIFVSAERKAAPINDYLGMLRRFALGTHMFED